MEGRGSQTKMPRAALPRSGESGDAIIMLVAFGVASLFVAVQIGFAIVFAPVMIAVFDSAGMTLTPVLAFAQTLGPLGIFVCLAIFDAAVFALCIWAARRYWVGLLFLPPAIYLATTFLLFIGLVGGSAAAFLSQGGSGLDA